MAEVPAVSPLAPRQDGDFIALLASQGHDPAPLAPGAGAGDRPVFPEATTIVGFHCKDGVIIAGDRRATAGHTVIYDRADKVIEVDQRTIMAIAGTPATAFEMARILQHSFQYYRRSQLQPLSVDAKVRALGELIKKNLALTLQGVGVVVPLLAAKPEQGDPCLYFYDALGAQFQSVDFAVSGSGSPAARSVLQYLNRWDPKPPAKRDAKAAAALALQLLDVAAESDTATGGVDRRSEIYPQVKLLARDGIHTIPTEELAVAFEKNAQRKRKGAAA